MSDKIISPVELVGETVELTLDFSSDEASLKTITEKGKAQRGLSVANKAHAPKLVLPKEHVNCWRLDVLKKDPLLDDRIRALLPKWNFFLLEIPTSFQPGEGTRIVLAELEVELGAASDDQRPFVYRIIPEQVTTETKEKTEFGLDPSLEVKETAKISLGHWVKTVEINNLKPRITGFWHEHRASWEISPEGAQGVRGIKTFYLVLQRRIGNERCTLEIKAKAKVETPFGIFFTRKHEFSYQVSHKDFV
ncbi:MAG: hypothetical protein AABM67_21190 [Acidobacteriota bacterium]